MTLMDVPAFGSNKQEATHACGEGGWYTLVAEWVYSYKQTSVQCLTELWSALRAVQSVCIV